jgi:GH15 family glucan-1,4-alpha-glucosidase
MACCSATAPNGRRRPTTGEGTFLPCSFRLVDALALDGNYNRAAALFERLLGLRNDLGLLAEEYDPTTRRQLGNYPHAFSHIALINSAFNLANPAARNDPRARRAS